MAQSPGYPPTLTDSTMARLNDYKVLTFDCYGTLIDWETGIWDALQPVLMASHSDALTRATALAAFAVLESRHEAETPGLPYPNILARVHRDLAAQFGLHTNDGLDTAFGASVPHWPAFPDTADALRFLKNHFKLVILSNVDRSGFAASNRKLGVEFDAVYTAEDIGSYKPSAANFEYLVTRLRRDHGLVNEDILHTAQSLFHDHVPATDYGLAKAWIDRQRLSQSANWGATAEVSERPPVDFHFLSMADMAQAVASSAA